METLMSASVAVPIAVFTMVTLVSIGVPLAKAYARRIEGGGRKPSMSPDVVARLERMEQAIDSIAVEVERISEAQRFVAKLMAEQRAIPSGDASAAANAPATPARRPDSARP